MGLLDEQPVSWDSWPSCCGRRNFERMAAGGLAQYCAGVQGVAFRRGSVAAPSNRMNRENSAWLMPIGGRDWAAYHLARNVRDSRVIP